MVVQVEETECKAGWARFHEVARARALDPEPLVQAVVEVMERRRVPVDAIFERSHIPRICEARREVYEALVKFGLTKSDIGDLLGRHHSTIVSGLRKTTYRRDRARARQRGAA